MRLKLPTRIGISFAVAIVALVGILTVTIGAIDAARQVAARVHDNNIPSIDMAKKLLVRLERMENAEFMYFVPGQVSRDWMQRFDDDASTFETWYQAAEAVAQEPEERVHHAQMGHHFGAFKHIDARMRALIAAGRRV